MVISHNMPGINTRRNYNKNNSSLCKSLEKLSFGYMINRAADNAAGLAVSEKLRSIMSGTSQAVKNCCDGISMVQTYEGALQESENIVQRCRQLAVQSANGSYDTIDRETLQQEFELLCDDVNHIADTDFNGVVMLNGGRMADTFTVVGKNGTSWLFPEKIGYDRDSYRSTVKSSDYKMKIELLPDVAAASADKNTFEALARLDKARVAVDVKDGVPTFYFVGEAPAGFKIETVENEGIISFTSPMSGITKVAKVSVPRFTHNASSTAYGKWVHTSDGSKVNLKESILSCFDDSDLYDNTNRRNYFQNTQNAYNLGNTIEFTVLDDTAKHYSDIMGNDRHNWAINYNADIIKSGSKIICTPHKTTAQTTGYTMINGKKYDLGVSTFDFNSYAYVFYGSTRPQTLTLKADGKWYDENNHSYIDISTSGFAQTVKIIEQQIDPNNGTITDVEKEVPVTEITFQAHTPYLFDVEFDGYYYSNLSNSDLSLGEYNENIPDFGGIDYRIAEDGAVYTYKNSGINSSNPDTVGYWVDQNNNIVDLESVGVHLPKNRTAASDILHDGMTIKISNPLIGVNGHISAAIELWNSMADGFRVAYENVSYSDSLALQTGARSKDLVNFTMFYSSDGIGELECDLNCTAKGLGMDKLSIKTQAEANYSIDRLDHALNKISMVRSTFGAVQNRLEHKIDNLNNTSENLTAADSRIRDTDMAKEMMEFTKKQILSQSAQAIMPQADKIPQSILSLLSA